MSPANIPIFQFKTLIPSPRVLLSCRAWPRSCRCIICIRDGAWPSALHDVEELEFAILHRLDEVAPRATQCGGEIPR